MFKKGHTINSKRKPWNKGLKKESDERVLRQSVTFKSRVESGLIVPVHTGKTLSDDHKNKIKSVVNDKIAQGTWHLSFSKSRTHIYKGIKFHGTWEVRYAKYLDLNEIKWRRPIEKFEYEFNGEVRNYTPDFYLIDEDLYVEIKGHKTAKDEAKWKAFPLKLKVLFGIDLVDLCILQIQEIKIAR